VGAVFFCVLCVCDMSELYLAYSEYLERMLCESSDLVVVDLDTVPDGVPVTLTWLEWADFA